VLLTPGDGLRYGLLAGLAGLGALAAFYRALALGTMGVVAPVAALGVVLPVVVGLFQGEAPSRLQLLGIVVAVGGVVLASGPELSGEGRGGAQSLLLAIGAAVGFGVVFVLLAAGSSTGDSGPAEVLATLLAMRVASVTVLVVLLTSLVLRARSNAGGVPGGADEGAGAAGFAMSRRDVPVLVAIGLFDVGANGAFALASQADLLSVTAVLASLYPIVTALLARSLHGERLLPVQLAGVAAALTGVALLAGG
jgi:drug/metabolite transporter (DMT)-like permease